MKAPNYPKELLFEIEKLRQAEAEKTKAQNTREKEQLYKLLSDVQNQFHVQFGLIIRAQIDDPAQNPYVQIGDLRLYNQVRSEWTRTVDPFDHSELLKIANDVWTVNGRCEVCGGWFGYRESKVSTWEEVAAVIVRDWKYDCENIEEPDKHPQTRPAAPERNPIQDPVYWLERAEIDYREAGQGDPALIAIGYALTRLVYILNDRP